jgi:hypothetical protein
MSERKFPPKGSVYGDRWRKAHAANKRREAKEAKAASTLRATVESRIRMGDNLARDVVVRMSRGVCAHLFDFRTCAPTGRSLCREMTIEGSSEAGRIAVGDMPILMFYLPGTCVRCLEALVAR